jgi:hypothetical protein
VRKQGFFMKAAATKTEVPLNGKADCHRSISRQTRLNDLSAQSLLERTFRMHNESWIGLCKQHLPNHEAARDQAHRIVRELKEDGYHPGDAVLLVHDETGQTLHSIPF